MANYTGLPGNLYSGDAVVLNNDKYTNYYLQQAAHKKAKDEALDQYYRQELPKSTNPAGMRLQDIEGGYNKGVQDWQQHYIDNAQAIKNPKLDNGRAYNEHLSQYQQLQQKIAESKSAAAQEAEVAKLKLEGKYDPTDDDMTALHGLSSSIYSPQHYKDAQTRIQPYSLNDLSPSVPDFDEKHQSAFVKAATSRFPVKPQSEVTNIDKVNGTQTISKSHQYNSDELKGIGDQAGDLYDGDKTARKYFQSVSHDPQEHGELSAAFKNTYGHDPTTPKEFAQAFALSHAGVKTDLGSTVKNWIDPNKSYKLNNQRLGNSEKLFDYKQTHGVSQATSNFINNAPAFLNSGDPDRVDDYMNNFKTGGGKGVSNIKVTYEPPPMTPTNPFPQMGNKKLPTLSFTKREFVQTPGSTNPNDGTYEDVPHTIQLNPDAKDIKEQVANAALILKGKDNKVIRTPYNTDNVPAPAAQPKATKKTKSAEDKAEQLLNKYLPK